MSTASLVYMLLILGGVWGGFAYCLVQTARKKDPDA